MVIEALVVADADDDVEIDEEDDDEMLELEELELGMLELDKLELDELVLDTLVDPDEIYPIMYAGPVTPEMTSTD